MLQYFQSHSRPDLILAVSKVARFVRGAKRIHKVALERIGLNLKRALKEGLKF